MLQRGSRGNLLHSRNGRFLTFGLLYVSEGIPYGFTSVAMVAFMHQTDRPCAGDVRPSVRRWRIRSVAQWAVPWVYKSGTEGLPAPAMQEGVTCTAQSSLP